MEYLIGFCVLSWILLRESKDVCSLCHSKRKFKHLDTSIYLPGYHCKGGCLHVAFITGKPVMRNGQIEVEYNWNKD